MAAQGVAMVRVNHQRLEGWLVRLFHLAHRNVIPQSTGKQRQRHMLRAWKRALNDAKCSEEHATHFVRYFGASTSNVSVEFGG